MDSGKEQNYWPGFVDALSNVVLTLVFVLVIFVFALVIASSKAAKQVEELIDAKNKEVALEKMIEHPTPETTPQATPDTTPQDPQEVEKLEKQLSEAAVIIEELKKALSEEEEKNKKVGNPLEQNDAKDADNDNLDVADKPQEKAYVGTTSMVEKQNLITLKFPQSIAAMDEQSAAQLEKVFKTIQARVGPHKVILRSIVGRESFSVAKRMAYYRAIDVRNFLISKAGESPSSISAVIVQPDKAEDGRVEVIIRKN